MGRWYYEEYYPRSQPRVVKGGIKAQSRSGAFGANWWAKRWIAVLEGFHIGARLSRGKSYARSGQVLSIDVGCGQVTATVQGSRPTPYSVTIQVTPLTPAEWSQLGEALAGQALFAAKLLAGDMPQDIEVVFTSVGLSLFPRHLDDLQTDCSCPDWSNPCKHIAAVYYLLGEEFDRDPFLLFRLRGLSRNDLIGLLTAQEGGPGVTASTAPTEEDTIAPEPLPADVAAFWGDTGVPEDVYGEVRRPPVAAALLRRLGNFPFWRGTEPLLDAIEPVYSHASQRGLEVFLGQRDLEASV
jgi:uncharacterized Zn finger protein